VLPKDRISEKPIQTIRLFVLHHRTTDGHHERDRRRACQEFCVRAC
jgi:hypothetical protein